MTVLMAPLFASAAVFMQAQIKYGAERDDYLHRWYERPLHQNTAYAEFNDRTRLNPEAWKKTVESLRFAKADGFLVFPTRLDGQWGFLEKVSMPGYETKMLAYMRLAGKNGIEASLDLAERALKIPGWHSIDGKRVLLIERPNFSAMYGRLEGLTRELKKRLDERFGDRFLLLSQCQLFDKNDFGEAVPSEDEISRAKENLRRHLRVVDGLEYHMLYAGCVERRFDPRMFDAGTGRVIREVFAEEEFKGKKYLCIGFGAGHMNSYRWQYITDANATATLCGIYECMLKLSPDIVFHTEWDEENENTHFRPTVSRGNTYLRIVRHFKERLEGREPTPAPGDDVSVPNLVLSYRKAVVAGEAVEVEVRNIPDGTFKGETLEVSFEWMDMNGKTVRSYPAATLKADAQAAVRFSDPAAAFLDNRFLIPRFRVVWSKGSREYSSGLYPIGIRALRNVDHVWACHPLRDVPPDVSGKLEIGPPDRYGVHTVKGTVSSGTPLRSVEVLDAMETVYMHSSEPSVPPGHERLRVRIGGYARGKNDKVAAIGMLKGRISFRNVDGVKLKPVDFPGRKARVKDSSWLLDGMYGDTYGITLWADVPVDDMNRGVIDIDLSPRFKESVKLADLLKKEVVAFNSVDCLGLSVMRHFPPVSIPRPLMAKTAEFTFRWKPLEETSVLRLQTIDADYRVWRGAAGTVYRPSGKRVAFTVFDRAGGKPVTAEADAVRVKPAVCDVAGRTDSALRIGSGRMLTGMIGGSVEFAQGFGRGESHFGNPLIYQKKFYDGLPPGSKMPKSGWGCLSHQFVPGLAGFELAMKIRPAGFGEVQGLYDTGNCGLTVFIEKDGSVCAKFAKGRSFLRENGPLAATVRGPVLKDGEWNDVRVATDRRNAWIEVNGVRGEMVAYGDYLFNQRIGTFGVTLGKPNFFKGEIDSLSVRCR